jgi:hypothetical protein
MCIGTPAVEREGAVCLVGGGRGRLIVDRYSSGATCSALASITTAFNSLDVCPSSQGLPLPLSAAPFSQLRTSPTWHFAQE